MSSQIIETNPIQGSATTSSVRNNFGAAKKEINDLQKMSTMYGTTASSDGAAYTVTLTDQFETNTLVDGARITVQINTANTTGAPTLAVTAGSTTFSAITIVKHDGNSLENQSLKANAFVELMYDSSENKWIWLNSISDDPRLTSPNISSPTISGGTISGNPDFTGAPTSTTAAVDTNTTQIATTAFVQAQTATDARKGIAELATAAK